MFDRIVEQNPEYDDLNRWSELPRPEPRLWWWLVMPRWRFQDPVGVLAWYLLRFLLLAVVAWWGLAIRPQGSPRPAPAGATATTVSIPASTEVITPRSTSPPTPVRDRGH